MAKGNKRVRKRIPKQQRKSLQLWAEGMRETILIPHIQPYASALASGWRTERDYLKKVLEDHEEPETLVPFDPLARIPEEQLWRKTRLQMLRVDGLNKVGTRDHARYCLMLSNFQAHSSMAKVSPRSLRKQHKQVADPTKDPWAVLVAKLSGVKCPPKARQAYQQFMREAYATDIEPEVKKKWAEESGEGAKSVPARTPTPHSGLVWLVTYLPPYPLPSATAMLRS
ncbi:hypothetical protein B0H13DRAFT_2338310 [Mycena leptocephala]|nr:hypothetical protein B0H13DRAFT_2338310 [Mycena leptocephala]